MIFLCAQPRFFLPRSQVTQTFSLTATVMHHSRHHTEEEFSTDC